jgi:hypothetical protein
MFDFLKRRNRDTHPPAARTRARRQPLGQRVHDWLAEPEGEQFKIGKWRFWFIAVAFLSVVNATVTWLIFRDDSENYSGPIMVSAGTLVAWLCVAALHYSDSPNRQMSRWVSIVDSAALLFVCAHFAGLLYVYGHHRTLRSAEVRYEARANDYNDRAERLSGDNVKIVEGIGKIAENEKSRAKLENDTAYQLRKAAQYGGRLPGQRSSAADSLGSGITTAPIELEKPEKPKESSAEFLAKWDWMIRAANFGELFLACLTLILIRNMSAKTNTPAAPHRYPYPEPTRTGHTPGFVDPAPTRASRGETDPK